MYVLFGLTVLLCSFLKNWQIKSHCIISKAIRNASMYLSVENCKICNIAFAPAWSICWTTQSNMVPWIWVLLFLQLSHYIIITNFFLSFFISSLHSDFFKSEMVIVCYPSTEHSALYLAGTQEIPVELTKGSLSQ